MHHTIDACKPPMKRRLFGKVADLVEKMNRLPLNYDMNPV
jgi:hypothetical protein